MSLQSLPPNNDAHRDELRRRLNSTENQWAERKAKSTDEKEVRKTLVAFANTVRDGEWAALFIGALDNGKHPGVPNPDEVQKRAYDLAEKHCYPPVLIRPVDFTTTVDEKSVTIVAIEIPPSSNRPHFAGPSYIRVGSVSAEASAAQFEELIASRNDIVRKLQQIPRDVVVRVRSLRGLWFEFKGAFERPKPGEALKIDVYDSGGASIRVHLRDVQIISTDGIKPVLQIPPLGTDEAHLMDMLNHWRKYQHSLELFIDPKNEIVAQLVPFAPEVCILMAQQGWADNQRDRAAFDFFNKHAFRFR